jgi:hypothetical protein
MHVRQNSTYERLAHDDHSIAEASPGHHGRLGSSAGGRIGYE